MTKINDEGTKHDQGKVPLHLLSPVALIQIAQVLGHGEQVYGTYNWLKGMHWSRIIGATLRHLFSWMRGHDKDPETGFSHLAHAGCCIMFLLEYEARGLGTDDRYKEEANGSS